MMSLKSFSTVQAQNVFTTLAEEVGLTLEQALVDGFTKAVSNDDHLSPVDIGIGLLMLSELTTIKKTQQLSLADYHFAGGSQGLFVNFLKSKIQERFPDKAEQEELFKILLELVDLNRNQRLAEGKTLKELAKKNEVLSLKHLEFALNYFASSQVRMLEKVKYSNKAECYRLPHESMIPALRQLGNKMLSNVAQANLKLQTSYHAWQNSKGFPQK